MRETVPPGKRGKTRWNIVTVDDTFIPKGTSFTALTFVRVVENKLSFHVRTDEGGEYELYPGEVTPI